MKKLTAVLCALLITATLLTIVASAVVNLPVLKRNGNNNATVVRLAQAMLNNAGHYNLYTDGDFDKDTETAVNHFQKKIMGIAPTNTVNKATWIALFNKNTVQQGSRGKVVSCLQIMLNKVMKSGLAVDGAFGKNTKTAVKQFQKSCSLTQDGVVGIQTWTKLIIQYCNKCN